ncbi:MAG: class I SAM-dependent methyltransferase [Caldilineaceae bacterium]
MNSAPIKAAKNRAFSFVEQQQAALDDGQITEAEWFAIHNAFFTGHYLAADNPRDQSGHNGDEARYRYSRMIILEAIHKNGTFLDVGCANGYLVESLERWLTGSGLQVSFWGLDISAGLVELAKQRLPAWEERFLLGNALYWTSSMRYDFVYLCGLELVPVGRQRELIARLLDLFVAEDGRLILGPITEERSLQTLEEQLGAWGYSPTGYCEKSHQDFTELARKLFWFDKPSGTPCHD